ncbi:MAG: SIS domain-containing protein [Rubellimicrobium sp.]|nr:SIS domain-containing protein [Rubellimicrobium sp.]
MIGGAASAGAEIGRAAAATDPAAFEALAQEIAGAGQIVLHGAGREGLMMRALAMRLHHLGLAAQVWGDMAMPPVGPGDLVLLAAGPGDLPTVQVLAGLAARAGARTACVTAQPGGPTPRACDLVLTIPAQTMADDGGPGASVLPMGSVFEGAMFLVFEMLVLRLAELLEQSPEMIRARHANLE